MASTHKDGPASMYQPEDGAELLPELPLDILGKLLSFLPTLELKFLLFMTSQLNLRSLPSKVRTLKSGHSARFQDPSFCSSLAQLTGLTSTYITLAGRESKERQSMLAAWAPSLQCLSMHAPGGKFMRRNPTWIDELPVFPNVVSLRFVDFKLVPSPWFFKLFPQLRELHLLTSENNNIHTYDDDDDNNNDDDDDDDEDDSDDNAFDDLRDISLIASPLAQYCPHLTSLEFSDRISFRQLGEFKALKALTRVKAPMLFDRDLKKLHKALVKLDRNSSNKSIMDAVDKYCGFLEENVPGGFASLTGQYGLIEASMKTKNPDILREALRYTKQAGILLDSEMILSLFSIVFFDGNEPLLDLLRVMIESDVDMNAPYEGLADSDIFVEDILQSWPSIEMFQLFFEEKLAKNNTLTCFEHMQATYPDYPFFWSMPIFSRCLCEPSKKPEQVELLEYILENKERLLPIFGGSEAILGGPNIAEIYGNDPIDLVLPKLIDDEGMSVLDVFLRHSSFDLGAIPDYIQLNPPLTEHTVDLILGRASRMFRYEHLEELVPILQHLDPARKKQVLLALVKMEFFSFFATILLLDHFNEGPSGLDIVALELELLQDGGDSPACMFHACMEEDDHDGDPTILKELVSLVRASPLSSEVLKLWQLHHHGDYESARKMRLL